MLIEILSQEAKGAKLKLMLAALLPGLVDAALIAALQAGVQAGGVPDPQLFVVFCVLCVVQMVCLRANVKVCATVTETVLYKMRSRIADKLRRTEVQGLERIGDAEIYNRVIQATTMISNSIWVIVDMAQSAVLIACIALRLWPLSTPAFVLTVVVYGGGGAVFYLRRRTVRAIMIEAQATQVGLFGFLDDLIRGGKEIRLRTRRGDELLHDLEGMAGALQDAPFRINRILQHNFIIARMLLFFLLAVLVFVLPQMVAMTPGLVSAVVASAIFIFVPLTDLLRGLPEYERAELAASNLHGLEQRLDQAALVPAVRARAARSAPLAPEPFAAGFSMIEADQLCFSYPARVGQAHPDRFALGPVSLAIHAGELVFFVGGNGSGKTTLLKLLTGLYPASAGVLRVDQQPITTANLQAYRELTSGIFTDFHLFKRLYGLPERATAELDPWLARLQLTGKTAYGAAGFTRLELSTGQRKRLAMAVALLEDRPLYVFDEWAADQDPELRRYYYEQLLPELKRRGKTVLAISHDDRYFHCADRVVFMEYGTIRSVAAYPHPDAPSAPG